MDEIDFWQPYEFTCVFMDRDGVERKFRANLHWYNIYAYEEVSMHFARFPQEKTGIHMNNGREYIALVPYTKFKELYQAYMNWYRRTSYIPMTLSQN